MRILTLFNSLIPGGIQHMTLQSLPLLAQQGITTDFAVCQAKGALEREALQAGAKIIKIDKTPSTARATRQLAEILATDRYDLVHSHFGFTSGAYARAAQQHDVPIAVSLHNVERTVLTRWRDIPLLKHARKALLRHQRKLMDRHVTMFVGHSASNLNDFQPDWRSTPSRYRVVMNGIQFPPALTSAAEARRSLGIATREKVLLHIGRFGPAKNHEGLLEIMQRVSRQTSNARLIVLGEGNSRARIERLAHQMGLSDKVQFVGERMDVWTFYAAADVFVFPSLFEGFGNVLVEAQAAGLPVVASDIPPHREAVAPAQHGFLFELPHYDRAAQMVLDQLESGGGTTSEPAQQAASYVRKHFSIERYANDLIRLYQDLAAGPQTLPRRAA
jgi:glycosyltransferase EpsF